MVPHDITDGDRFISPSFQLVLRALCCRVQVSDEKVSKSSGDNLLLGGFRAHRSSHSTGDGDVQKQQD